MGLPLTEKRLARKEESVFSLHVQPRAIAAQPFLIFLVFWIHQGECFFEVWTVVFVEDVGEFVGYEIVDDLR